MKIISLNRELTIDARNLAFNVDEDLTPDLMSFMSYGALKLSGEGRVLRVSLPQDSDEDFDYQNVSTLEGKLATAAAKVQHATEKRQRMLKDLAEQMNLDLD
ncbi:hypothetical protein [Delftia acidovorans]|uniref:Uncharacterized protein n=1 Tax=Delftia acidovorans TaxID=80866 RepID=A0AAJ2R5T7_DELAC|nr:hypothetical protein [Delftia acidovorans]MDX4958116.1 hypothetical protein [Delftia acidovorans]